ncbi:MAG: hypothetical protein WCC38_08270 [Pseudonocardiaceae bacterium]
MIAGNVVTMIRDIDIEGLLRRQHGAVSRAQLREAGVNANTIDTWVRRDRLWWILPAVYSTGPPSLATPAHAAHLWQPKGLVSHLAAAHLWKMAINEPSVVHLTVPLNCARTSPARWLRLFRRDSARTRRSTVSGWAVTDVPRTVFDCLVLLDDPACAALLDHATATLTSDRALRMRYLEDLGLRGSPRIARQLASLVPGAASAPERLLAHGLHSAGLTGFLVNEPAHGYIADFLDPARRLILEVDGYRTQRHVARLPQRPGTAERAGGSRVHRAALHSPRCPDPARINPRRDRRRARPRQSADLMITECEIWPCKIER